MKTALDYAKILNETGLKKETSEQAVRVIYDIMDHKFVTKSDFNEFNLEMRAEFKILRQEMDYRFKEFDQKLEKLKSDMTIRLGSMMFVMTGFNLSVMKSLLSQSA